MHQQIKTLFKELPFGDAVSIFEHLQHKKWALLFDSALLHEDYGRYSYIAIEPFKTLWVKDGQIRIDDILIAPNNNPFLLLKELLSKFSTDNLPQLPPFQGGAAGAFAYDLYQYLENIPLHAVDSAQFPEMAIGFYDVVIAFDSYQKQAWLISTGLPLEVPAARLERAQNRLNYFLDLLYQCRAAKPVDNKAANLQNLVSNFTKDAYIKAVETVKGHILAGDIFQANISQRFQAELPSGLSAFALYKHLRKINPAPFAAFFNLGGFQVLSASPERFLHLIDNKVETRPIKGTSPRSSDFELDRRFAQKLKKSAKDRAENIMIVDLMRNDLSKVCKDHSVSVSQLCGLESYALVHHLVSVVNGELRPDQDAVDLLMAAFPGGSVTGAPKIRAMEIIAQIERSRRGLYCGSLGFIGFNGSMDTSIVIRTYIINNKIVSFQAGGAIVLDSDPADEYQETLIKLRGFLKTCNYVYL